MSGSFHKLALLGVACAALLLGAVILLAGSGGSSGDLDSYYFEARIEVVQDEEQFGEEQPLDTMRGWYDAPGKWRWEFGDSSEEGSVQVSDGESVWFYDRPTNTYYRQAAAAYYEGRPPELAQGPPLMVGGFLIGWLPYGDEQRFFDAWGDDAELDEAAGDEIAGRPTSTVTMTRDGTTITFWLDRDLPFVLKYEARSPDDPQRLVRAEIVDLQLNQELEGQPFSFQAPEDAREIDPPGSSISGSSSSGTIGTGDVQVPEGFLDPSYIPAGYVTIGSSSRSSGVLDGRQTRFSVTLQPQSASSSDSDYLRIEQQFRAGGLPESRRSGESVTIGDSQAYDQSTADEARLLFARDDIIVSLTSDTLPLAELTRVAESMQPG